MSLDACQLVLQSDLIDLHVDTELPFRLFGYDPLRRHRHWWPNGNVYFGQVDFPRLLEGGFTGVVWDIVTNPYRQPASRAEVTLRNIERVLRRSAENSERLACVRGVADYHKARSEGKLCLWIGIQGGNAFEYRLEDLDRIPQDSVCRVTVVHLTSSVFGTTSSPLRMGAESGLSTYGKDFIRALQSRRILVDLAHIHPRGFWDAVEAADPQWPLIASHTGVNGVYRHWRNLDDDQIRAIARSGGVVGVIYHSYFLKPGLNRCTTDAVLDHLEHISRVGGEDCPALGSDYDGLIVPPTDLRDPTWHPCLVQKMLDRKWSESRIRKTLGLNWLRALAAVRP